MWQSLTILGVTIQLTFGIEITAIPAPFAGIGFATIWDDCTQSVYYVDYIATGQNFSIFRYGFNEDRGYGAYIDGITTSPSFILPIKDCNKYKKLFVVGVGHDTIIIEWDGKSPAAKISTLFSVEQSDQNSRWCLAKQSKHGHFYGGTNHVTFCNAPKNASLYMYSPNKGVTRLFGDLISTTGLAYDRDHLYHADACTNLITAFDANSCGDICNGRIVYDFTSLGFNISNFVPVGMDIDTDGFLYVGNYAGKEIWKINTRTSSGIPIIQMPYDGIGGLTFGGPNRDTLFITTVKSYVDVLLAKVTKTSAVPTSLYKITGLGATAHGSSRLNLHD